MKKGILLIWLTLCSMLPAPCSFAQALIFSNQTITVNPQNLSVESVEFRPLEVVINTVFQWMDADAVYTNLYYGWKPDEIVTNTVSQQVSVNVISTNAATWTCNVIFSLPAGHVWSLNGMPVTIERFKTRLQIPVSQSAVQSLFGSASAGLEFAAQNGAYQPTGQVKNGFLSLAAAVLAGGAQ